MLQETPAFKKFLQCPMNIPKEGRRKNIFRILKHHFRYHCQKHRAAKIKQSYFLYLK